MNQRSFRPLLTMAVALGAALGAASDWAQPIRIGFQAPLTGPAASDG